MRAVWSSVALLYALASIFLVQVLAAPEADSNSNFAHSKVIVARESSIGWPEIRRADIVPRGVLNVEVKEARYITDGAVKTRVEKTRFEKERLSERDQAWATHLEREAVSVSPIVERQNGELDQSSLVLRSAAPKVFGISIYLIIAWLALMYLMYRTGSF